jgi:hypothetical protein
MITPPTECFYMIQAQGEAAEIIAAKLSLGSMSDIMEAVLVSEDYNNDIQATIGLDSTIASMKQELVETQVVESTDFNPLYKPSTQDEIDEVLDGEDSKTETFRFVGMYGNPFMLKSTRLLQGEDEIITGHVSCRPFDLPSYSDIVAGQATMRLN